MHTVAPNHGKNHFQNQRHKQPFGGGRDGQMFTCPHQLINSPPQPHHSQAWTMPGTTYLFMGSALKHMWLEWYTKDARIIHRHQFAHFWSNTILMPTAAGAPRKQDGARLFFTTTIDEY